MSFVDSFFELTANLPREIVRMLKLIKEVDEKSVEMNKELSDNKKIYLSKQKIKNDFVITQQLAELYNKIDQDYQTCISLASYKIQLINELHYMIFDNNMNDINKIIEKGEKEVKIHEISNNQKVINNVAFSQGPKSTDDSFQNSIRSRKKGESITGKNLSSSKELSKFIGKKKNRVQKTKKKKIIYSANSDVTELDYSQQTNNVTTTMGNETGDGVTEQVFCSCRGPSYGNMIACDNPDCPIQWFHYECVGIKDKPHDNSHWYCPSCKAQALVKEEKTKKKKRKM